MTAKLRPLGKVLTVKPEPQIVLPVRDETPPPKVEAKPVVAAGTNGAPADAAFVVPDDPGVDPKDGRGDDTPRRFEDRTTPSTFWNCCSRIAA